MILRWNLFKDPARRRYTKRDRDPDTIYHKGGRTTNSFGSMFRIRGRYAEDDLPKYLESFRTCRVIAMRLLTFEARLASQAKS